MISHLSYICSQHLFPPLDIPIREVTKTNSALWHEKIYSFWISKTNIALKDLYSFFSGAWRSHWIGVRNMTSPKATIYVESISGNTKSLRVCFFRFFSLVEGMQTINFWCSMSLLVWQYCTPSHYSNRYEGRASSCILQVLCEWRKRGSGSTNNLAQCLCSTFSNLTFTETWKSGAGWTTVELVCVCGRELSRGGG